MKFMLTLFACLVALATAAPALAGNGQSVSESVGAVQASSTNANPAVSVVAPVGASAPVCVASECSTSQPAAPVSSASSTTGGGQSRTARQKASHSAGAVQVGSTNVSPTVSAAAPVGASAPVCVASRCSTSQSSGQAGSGASTTNGGQSRPSGQRVSQSVGAAQVDSTTVNPAASVAAPIGAVVPVCVASGCSVSQSQTSEPKASQTSNAVPHGAAGKSSRSKSAGSVGPRGAERGVGNNSAVKGRGNGPFAPVAGPRHSPSTAAEGQEGEGQEGEEHHAAHSNGCAFSGASAKLNGSPTAARLVPSGAGSLTLLLAIACGLFGFASLSQWVGSEVRWWKG
jgi:hypothetical protein